MNRRTLAAVALGASLTAALTGLVVHQVRAIGIPTMPTMVYRGTLEGASAGPHMFRVAVFTLASGGAETACNSGATTTTLTPVNGAFELPLVDACTSVVHANHTLWLELTVDGTARPRTKLGAGPFAIEAENATAASTGSALDMRLASLEARLTTLTTQNATLTTQLAVATNPNPDCPRGYTLAPAESPGTVCTRAVMLGTTPVVDHVVKVGTVGAFWIDRFEASIHQSNNGTPLGTANGSGGVGTAVESSGLQPSGAHPRGAAPAQALSHPGFPSVNMTWFQANEACVASGKHLATRTEWLAAASGTTDDATCNVSSGGALPAATTRACISAAGVHDVIGNVWEWTDEWYTGAGSALSVPMVATMPTVPAIAPQRLLDPTPTSPWPTGYSADNDDRTWNVNSRVSNGSTDVSGMPSAAVRGGDWNTGTQAGVFSLDLNLGPSNRNPSVGFRCVLPR